MKPTLKQMLLATLCCLLLTAVDLLFGSSWTSPHDFRTALYWIIVLIGWIVFFRERIKHK